MTEAAESWREAVAAIIGDEDALAAEIAERLEEPTDEVRTTARLWLLLHSVDATSANLETMIGSLRAQARGTEAPDPADDVDARTLDELLGRARGMRAEGLLDLDAVIAIQREAGAISAREGTRLVLFLARLAFGRRLVWDRCVAEAGAGRLDPTVLERLGTWLLLWTEMTSLAVTNGYRAAEREILARDAEARRAAIDELLGVVAVEATGVTRLRRIADRFGLDPDHTYRLIVVAVRPEADPTPDRPGLDLADLDLIAGRIGHLLGSAPAAAEGAGPSIRLPAVLAFRGLVVVLAEAVWGGVGRVPSVLDRVLGPGAGGGPAWLAVGSGSLHGIAALAAALADMLDAVRTGERIGRTGWVADTGDLAVERLLLASRELGAASVARELGPLLADERLGEELVETLQVYFDAGENMREAARRLHLANRTVAYRLERIEHLLGGPLEGERRRRLAVALLVRRLGVG